MQETLGLCKSLLRGRLVPALPGRFALLAADYADVVPGGPKGLSVAPAPGDLAGTFIPIPGL